LQVSTKYGDSYQLPTALQGGYLLNRAIDRYNKGNYDLAMKDLNEIIEKKYPSVLADANNPRKFFSGIAVAYYYRGAIKAANGQYDEALSDYSMAIKDGQTYPEAYKSRSNIFIAKGKYDQAISDLDQALRLNPKEPTIRGGSSTFRWANTTGPYRT
jgi:tetratricopeptide (TPR) repeat protein